VVASVVLVADQLSKYLIRSGVAPGQVRHLVLGVTLVRVRNSGASFNLLSSHGIIVDFLALIVIAAVGAYLARKHGRRGVWLGCGLIVGGAISNLADRVYAGVVTDFVQLPHWPVAFNLADIAVVFGAVTLFLLLATEPLSMPAETTVSEPSS
jgi:signal peptidase II